MNIFFHFHFLLESKLVREWLEKIAPDFDPVEVRSGYWNRSVKRIPDDSRRPRMGDNSPSSQSLSEFDPDAPIRRGTNLVDDDQVMIMTK